ncbi:MAG: hypothetical protein LBQ28_01975 [Prevotellaceae bacterium]|jgi:hypothetical protein|nr:hypothetical protein [Prevotellaceae bacterium]
MARCNPKPCDVFLPMAGCNPKRCDVFLPMAGCNPKRCDVFLPVAGCNSKRCDVFLPMAGCNPKPCDVFPFYLIYNFTEHFFVFVTVGNNKRFKQNLFLFFLLQYTQNFTVQP